MSRRRRDQETIDAELEDLPQALRWREWMGRVEAAIFAARDPLPRETLAALVGKNCNLDDLIADIRNELRARPYDLIFIAGGYQFRTRPRFSDAIRVACPGNTRASGCPELTRTEMLAVTAIAYLQPATRAQLTQMVAKEVSRDVIAALKRYGLIDAALRAPEAGAPIAYVTTKKFLEVFGLGSLRDLPDIDRWEEEGLLTPEIVESELDRALLPNGDDIGADNDSRDLDFEPIDSDLESMGPP